MIAVLRNYQSVVDAKAWVVDGVNKEMLVDDTRKAIELSRGKAEPVFPVSVTNNFKQVVGVTFNEAEGAVEEMYNFNWASIPHYGDLLIVGNRKEILHMPSQAVLYLWMKNDRDTHLGVVFDFKKFMNPDPQRRSHRNGKCLANFCPPNVMDYRKDEATLTVMSIVKEDEPVVEDDVLTIVSSNEADTRMFSSLL